MFTLLFVIVVFNCLDNVLGEEIECEELRALYCRGIDCKECKMTENTTIDKANVTISNEDHTVVTLSFSDNKKISYLPVNVAESFWNLWEYTAQDCSIKELFKANFAGLRDVHTLLLFNNQIELIYSDTFEDMRGLQMIFLSKKMNY